MVGKIRNAPLPKGARRRASEPPKRASCSSEVESQGSCFVSSSNGGSSSSGSADLVSLVPCKVKRTFLGSVNFSLCLLSGDEVARLDLESCVDEDDEEDVYIDDVLGFPWYCIVAPSGTVHYKYNRMKLRRLAAQEGTGDLPCLMAEVKPEMLSDILNHVPLDGVRMVRSIFEHLNKTRAGTVVAWSLDCLTKVTSFLSAVVFIEMLELLLQDLEHHPRYCDGVRPVFQDLLAVFMCRRCNSRALVNCEVTSGEVVFDMRYSLHGLQQWRRGCFSPGGWNERRAKELLPVINSRLRGKCSDAYQRNIDRRFEWE